MSVRQGKQACWPSEGLQVSIFFLCVWVGDKAASQRVSECCSVLRSSYFHPLVYECSCRGSGATDLGHAKERKQMTINREGDEIQDGGMDWRDEEAGVVLFTSRHASGLRVRWWCCTAGTASCSPESWASILHNGRASTGWRWAASYRNPYRWDTCIGLLAVSASPVLWFELSGPP